MVNWENERLEILGKFSSRPPSQKCPIAQTNMTDSFSLHPHAYSLTDKAQHNVSAKDSHASKPNQQYRVPSGLLSEELKQITKSPGKSSAPHRRDIREVSDNDILMTAGGKPGIGLERIRLSGVHLPRNTETQTANTPSGASSTTGRGGSMKDSFSSSSAGSTIIVARPDDQPQHPAMGTDSLHPVTRLRSIAFLEGDSSLQEFPDNLLADLRAYCRKHETENLPCATERWPQEDRTIRARDGRAVHYIDLKSGLVLKAARYLYGQREQMIVVQGPLANGEAKLIQHVGVDQPFQEGVRSHRTLWKDWRGEQRTATKDKTSATVARVFSAIPVANQAGAATMRPTETKQTSVRAVSSISARQDETDEEDYGDDEYHGDKSADDEGDSEGPWASARRRKTLVVKLRVPSRKAGSTAHGNHGKVTTGDPHNSPSDSSSDRPISGGPRRRLGALRVGSALPPMKRQRTRSPDAQDTSNGSSDEPLMQQRLAAATTSQPIRDIIRAAPSPESDSEMVFLEAQGLSPLRRRNRARVVNEAPERQSPPPTTCPFDPTTLYTTEELASKMMGATRDLDTYPPFRYHAGEVKFSFRRHVDNKTSLLDVHFDQCNTVEKLFTNACRAGIANRETRQLRWFVVRFEDRLDREDARSEREFRMVIEHATRRPNGVVVVWPQPF